MNITNRKKVSFALISIIIFAFLTTGCFGDAEKPKAKVSFEEVKGDNKIMEAWADGTQGDGGASHVEETITVNLDSSMLNYVKVTVKVDDSDADHAESDEGGEPDMFRIKINSSGIESEIASGNTPNTVVLEIPPKNATADATGADEQVTIGPELTIFIEADCASGKPYKPFAPNRPGPSPFVYVDQGIYYSITIEYTYLEMT